MGEDLRKNKRGNVVSEDRFVVIYFLSNVIKVHNICFIYNLFILMYIK